MFPRIFMIYDFILYIVMTGNQLYGYINIWCSYISIIKYYNCIKTDTIYVCVAYEYRNTLLYN